MISPFTQSFILRFILALLRVYNVPDLTLDIRDTKMGGSSETNRHANYYFIMKMLKKKCSRRKYLNQHREI